MLGGRRRSHWLKSLSVALAMVSAAAVVIVLLNATPPLNRGRVESAACEATGQANQGHGKDEDELASLHLLEEEGREAVAQQDEGQAQVEAGESPAPTPAPEGSGTPIVVPVDESPCIEIELPVPDQGTSPGDGGAPADGQYEDIRGAWVINMTGSMIVLKNCYIDVNEDGTMTCPSSYDAIMVIEESEYAWEKGKAEFTAVLQVLIKMESMQGLTIPARIELEGTVADSLWEIKGNFVAIPEGDAFAAYKQEGPFVMQRRP
ncbi:MAG: hypothetical protein C4536_02965 [Actinobacteria bacterium]|nr:MAG: hypothetical protein C4536_02965 [Actinomycetota bacterium]